MWHGGGWFMYMRSGDEKPKVTRELLLRVLAYARGYWWQIAGMLVTILLTTGLSLLTPLIFRNMIDVVLPAKDLNRLMLLAIALLLIPAVEGGINVIQRRLNATVGEASFTICARHFSRGSSACPCGFSRIPKSVN